METFTSSTILRKQLPGTILGCPSELAKIRSVSYPVWLVPYLLEQFKNTYSVLRQILQQQHLLRLQRLDNERRLLQQKQLDLEKLEQSRIMRQQQVMSGNRFHDNIQAAVNATQEMLMRQNLNDPTSPQSTGKTCLLSNVDQLLYS
jgi:hypothetical protein